MKTKSVITIIFLAIIATLLSATGLYAQQASFNPEIGNGRWAAIAPPISAAVNDGGYFNPEIGNAPAISAAFERQSPPEHTLTTGKLRLHDAITLADVVLPAGDYEFRLLQAGEQQFVEFSELVTDYYAPEGQSPYQSLVVARVNATVETLAIAGVRNGSLTTTPATFEGGN